MPELIVDWCQDGQGADAHYPRSDWDYLGCDGLCFGEPSDQIKAVATGCGAQVIAYAGDGIWNFYRKRLHVSQ